MVKISSHNNGLLMNIIDNRSMPYEEPKITLLDVLYKRFSKRRVDILSYHFGLNGENPKTIKETALHFSVTYGYTYNIIRRTYSRMMFDSKFKHLLNKHNLI